MPDIVISAFQGAIPRMSSRILPENTAVQATNVDLHTGELRGMQAPSALNIFPEGSNARRAFHLREYEPNETRWYFMEGEEGEIVKSPLSNDAFNRWYVFGKGRTPAVLTWNEVKTNSIGSRLALFGPRNPPALVATGGTGTLREDRVYAYAFVSEWGEETQLSPPETIRGVLVTATVTVSELMTSPPRIDGRTWKSIRIYRSVVGGSTSSLRFVADVPYGNIDYVDNQSNTLVSLNDTAPDSNDPPMEDIYGVRVHPSGSLIAFTGRTVCFSRPYLPHSWPESWRINVPDPIVGLEVIGESVVVLTKGCPVVLYGASPASLGMTVSPHPAPCLNYASIVNTESGVYYASPRGIMVASQGGTTCLSEQVMTSKEWSDALRSEQVYALASTSQYVGFREDGTGFCFDWTNGDVRYSELAGTRPGVRTFRDRQTGLPGILYDDVAYAWGWGTGKESPYRWRSKEFYLEKPENFESIQVELEPRIAAWEPQDVLADITAGVTGTDWRNQIHVRVWADRDLVYSGPVSNRRTAPLPAGRLATVWQVELEGQCRVHRVSMSSSSKGQQRV